ncbi:MAG: hypothetical protein ABW166_09660 [Sedimenticola sp.]
MLKQSITAIWQRLFAKQSDRDPQQALNNNAGVTRRTFFKRAAFGAASITGTAGLAKSIVDSAPRPDMKGPYVKDNHAGEDELRNREYVLMSDEEKAEMVNSFIDSYSSKV